MLKSQKCRETNRESRALAQGGQEHHCLWVGFTFKGQSRNRRAVYTLSSSKLAWPKSQELKCCSAKLLKFEVLKVRVNSLLNCSLDSPLPKEDAHMS